MVLHVDVIAHIDALTKERGWSQYRLAKEADLPQTTIANIFCRGTVPSIATLEMLCNAFQMTLSDFFAEAAPAETILSSEQKRLLSYWDALTPKRQHIIMELLQDMTDDTN